jgi:long-chain acyl-CoA synthetase
VALLAPTSGTTGEPKLAELTHGNLLMSAAARAVLVRHQPFDRVLSWLPLTHLYALNADVVKGLLAGVQAVRPVRARGILRALGKWRPTHFQAVPRLYEKAWHLAGGEKATEESLKRVFGGRMRWAGCGGAPLPGWLAEGYARLGLPILEGYGLTEASPLVTMNTPEAHRAGTAGRVVPGMGVEIAADGEILVRGAGVMRGYHRDAGATARVLREGWLHTGDLGTLEDGYLRVTGRKNDLIVLSTGRKVMPARVEGALLALPWVETAVAFGDGEPRVRALVRARAGMTPMWSIRTLEGLEEHEQPARLLVMDRPLSAERGEVTALGKVNRAVVVRHFTGTV